MRTILKIKGTHCSSCKILIEDICSDYNEINISNMDLKSEELTIEHDNNLNLSKLKEEIKSSGNYKFIN
jgi:cation transport ATPase|tara:strand:+ start:3746 stop:3952 length:207 start_codon:yes stop_codon:yes gene_type:complete